MSPVCTFHCVCVHHLSVAAGTISSYAVRQEKLQFFHVKPASEREPPDPFVRRPPSGLRSAATLLVFNTDTNA